MTTLAKMEACARRQLKWMQDEDFDLDVIDAQQEIIALLVRLQEVEQALAPEAG